EDTYHLRAVHPGTLEVVELPDVDAGARDVRVTFGARAGTRVAGRVLYRDGAPARGVRVYPLLSRRGRDSRGRPPFLVESGRSTDDGGRFEFEELHFDGIRLWITGDQIGEPAKRLEVDLAASADLEDIEVRVAHVVQFEVALVDPTEADAFSAADAEGQLLSLLFTLLGSGRSTSTVGARMKLTGGRSEVVHCSEDVRTLILLRDGQEVRRVPVRVEPGDVRVLEF
ncbi:MAG: hypothetical protein O2816_04115, partial [Planctomycetota bacterium]|nr:hypothetical protein [Planctomycetota bacterium]